MENSISQAETGAPGNIADLDYSALLDCRVDSFKTAGSTRGDVLLLRYGDQYGVLKDYTQSGRGFAYLFAPFLVSREIKALKALKGVRGVPELFKKVNNRSFLMEHLPSKRIRLVQENLDFNQFIARTEQLVSNLHDRGVIHGDLRNATNILVDEEHYPVFVDYVSAVHRGRRNNPLAYVFFRMCLKIDQSAMYKLKKKYAPELIGQAEREDHEHFGPLEKTLRWMSIQARILFQRIFR